MTSISAPDAASAKQLLSFIERIENLEEEKKIVVHFVSHENFNRIYKIILFTEVFKFPRISIIF